MDSNHANKFTNHNPNLEIISMDSQIFHDQIPFINPSCYLQTPSSSSFVPIPFMEEEEEEEELGAMKEMMYKIAAMQPVDIDPATIRKPKRRNVRISDDPQSVAARHRRERISERIRILQRLVPGGTKMDTASMLDEAIRYVKFLKRQIRLLQSINNNNNNQNPPCIGGWQPIASTASSTLESPASAAGVHGFAFGGSGGNPVSMSYNHEVISD